MNNYKTKGRNKMLTLTPDSSIENADWTKVNSWDLPYTSEEELKKGLGDSYVHFKELPAYASRPWAIAERTKKLLKRVKGEQK